MRDVAIGYGFIFFAMFTFLGSVFFRQKRLLRRRTDLKEELRDSSRKA